MFGRRRTLNIFDKKRKREKYNNMILTIESHRAKFEKNYSVYATELPCKDTSRLKVVKDLQWHVLYCCVSRWI